jgi:hypothetical protein
VRFRCCSRWENPCPRTGSALARSIYPNDRLCPEQPAEGSCTLATSTSRESRPATALDLASATRERSLAHPAIQVRTNLSQVRSDGDVLLGHTRMAIGRPRHGIGSDEKIYPTEPADRDHGPGLDPPRSAAARPVEDGVTVVDAVATPERSFVLVSAYERISRTIRS